jgi:3',5'-cyclic AMP phosphodiesterase CpdA
VIASLERRLRALAPIDLLIVAGDVSHDESIIEASLAPLRPLATDAVFVAGNHDLWVRKDGPQTSRERYELIVPARVRDAGFFPLGQRTLILPSGLRVCGVTGWYDYSLRCVELDDKFPLANYRRGTWGRLRWNDKLHIVWPGDDGTLLDDEQICAAQVASLTAQLTEAPEAPTLVVTHHLPFAELITRFGGAEWDFVNGFMGSARLGEAICAAPGVKLACAGHTHFRRSARIEREGLPPLVVEVSPVGYPREYRRAGLNLDERVEKRVTLLSL